MAFDLFGGSNPSTRQYAYNQQVTGTGGSLGFGSGTIFNLGSTTVGKNQDNRVTGGKRAKPSKNSAPASLDSVTGGNTPSPANNNILTITTTDVNAIDLASHALDVQAVSNANALQAVSANNSDIFNSALNANAHIFDTAAGLFLNNLNSAQRTTDTALSLAAATIPQQPNNTPLTVPGNVAPSPVPQPTTTTTTTPSWETGLLYATIAFGLFALVQKFKP